MKRISLAILLPAILFFLIGCADNKSKEYMDDLVNVADDMLRNSANAEEVLGMYSEVWRFSIENSSPIPVDSMVEFTGLERDVVLAYFEINNANNITNDFSSNVHSLKSYYEGTGKLGAIEEMSKDIKNNVSNLSSPPKEFERAYDEILDMYDLTEEYISMTTNPSGSLQEFNNRKSELSNEILSKYKRIEVLIPDDE